MKHEVERSLVEVALDTAARTAEARLHFAADLSIFAGHFPGMPLVPGIYLVEASRLLAERVTGRSLEITEVLDARFTGEVRPDDEVIAHAAVIEADGGWHCTVGFSTARGRAAKVRLVLGNSGPSAGRDHADDRSTPFEG